MASQRAGRGPLKNPKRWLAISLFLLLCGVVLAGIMFLLGYVGIGGSVRFGEDTRSISTGGIYGPQPQPNSEATDNAAVSVITSVTGLISALATLIGTLETILTSLLVLRQRAERTAPTRDA